MGKGKLYNIKVTAKSDKNGDIVFTPKTYLPHSTSNGKDIFTFNKTDNDMYEDDFYLVQFTLDDKTKPKKNLRFPEDVDEAFWSRLSPTKAHAVSNCLDEQEQDDDFRGLAVLNDNCLLAINKDSSKRFIVFTLKFLCDGNPDFVLWDPIDAGQNAGKPRS